MLNLMYPAIKRLLRPCRHSFMQVLCLTGCVICTLTIALQAQQDQAPDNTQPLSTRTIIAERMTTVDGVPTMLEVEIRAPSIEADRKYSQQEIETLLQRFVGRWRGRYVISLIDGRQVADMSVEQHYWIQPTDNGHILLKGTAAYLHNQSLSYAQSESWIENGVLYSKISEQETDRFYEGRIQENGATITWIPAIAKGETHTEQITEYFGQQGNLRTILTLGFRQHIRQEYETLLMIEGELVEVVADQDSSKETIRGRVGGQLLNP